MSRRPEPPFEIQRVGALNLTRLLFAGEGDTLRVGLRFDNPEFRIE